RATVLILGARVRYLAEIAEQGRAINTTIDTQSEIADRAQSYWQSLHDLEDPALPKQLDLYQSEALVGAASAATPQNVGGSNVAPTSAATAQTSGNHVQVATHVAPTDRTLLTLRQRYNDAIHSLSADAIKLLRHWPERLKSITDEITEYEVRGKKIRVEN